MQTAGRSVLFSGATVAIGLGLLLFVPVPFVRSLGIGGFLVPLFSIVATATLQPALLSVLGVRGMRRIELLPAARDLDHGFWSRLARGDHAEARALPGRRRGGPRRSRDPRRSSCR